MMNWIDVVSEAISVESGLPADRIKKIIGIPQVSKLTMEVAIIDDTTLSFRFREAQQVSVTRKVIGFNQDLIETYSMEAIPQLIRELMK